MLQKMSGVAVAALLLAIGAVAGATFRPEPGNAQSAPGNCRVSAGQDGTAWFACGSRIIHCRDYGQGLTCVTR